jgi:hypothetical protein
VPGVHQKYAAGVSQQKKRVLVHHLQNFKISKFKLGKFIDINKGQINFKVKFQFFTKSATFDEKDLYLLDKLELSFYKWTKKSHCCYTIRNAALIQKIIRLLSLKSTVSSTWELFLLLIDPYSDNKPLHFARPQIGREHALLSNLYFDEVLLGIFSETQFSLSLHRFKVTNQDYVLYPGIVEGLAKPPAGVVDYHKPNHFDLSAMPQESLKYQLVAAIEESAGDIKRYHNVRAISYEIRRDILGAGPCDVRFEIFVADAPHFRQKSMAEDMDISAANADLFYAAIATRISNILINEISKPEYQNKEVDLLTKTSVNPFNRPLHQDLGRPVQSDFTPKTRYFKPNTDVTLERAFREYAKSPPSSKVSVEEMLPAPLRTVEGKKDTLEKVVDKIQFVNRLLRMKGLVAKDKDKRTGADIVQRKRGDKPPKIFKENEVVMFKLSFYPTKSRTVMHKLVLSSADIVKMFNVSDFLIEGLGLSVLNWKTIAWIAGMDSKTIFNYFCSFLCSRVIMKRWILYKRPFFIYSKDITRHMYLHQNNFLLEEQKSTPKLLPFLSVQSLDFEYIFHKVTKHKGLFVVVTLLKKPKDQIFMLKVFVQSTCRTFTAHFKTEDLQSPLEDFMCSLIYLILCEHPSDLPTKLEGLMKSMKRMIPKKEFTSQIIDSPEAAEFKVNDFEKNKKEKIDESLSSSNISESEKSLVGVAKEKALQAMKLASSQFLRNFLLERNYSTIQSYRI